MNTGRTAALRSSHLGRPRATLMYKLATQDVAREARGRDRLTALVADHNAAGRKKVAAVHLCVLPILYFTTCVTAAIR